MSPSQLAEHAAFLRRLARGLVSDPSVAEDLVSETYAVAMKKSPDERGARAWMAQVVRNKAFRWLRGEERRRRRERDCLPAEEVIPPDQIVQKEELTRAMVDEVFRLPEPYRSVIVLQFYEGLSAQEIGRKLGVPVETVRTRTKRAIAKLRERMDARNGGDRRSWSVALMAAFPAVEKVTVASVAVGVLAMSMLVKVTGVVLLAALVIVMLGRPDPIGAPVDSAGAPKTVLAEPSKPDDPQNDKRAAGVAAVERTEATAGLATDPSGNPWVIRGVVQLEDGAPVPDARVRLWLRFGSAEELADTFCGPHGRFEFDLLPVINALPWFQRRGVGLMVSAERAEFAISRSDCALDLSTPPDGDLVLTLKPLAPRLRVRVLAEDGPEIHEVRIALCRVVGEAIDDPASFGWASDNGDGRVYTSLPDEPGQYLIRVMVRDSGLGMAGPFELRPDRDFTAPDIVVSGPRRIDGVVVTPDGLPVSDVWVAAHRGAKSPRAWPEAKPDPSGAGLSLATADSDEAGRFVISGLAEGEFYLSVNGVTDPVVKPSLPVVAGTRGIRITVVRHMLGVTLVDEAGSVLPDARIRYRLAGESSRSNGSHASPARFRINAGPGTWEVVGFAAGRPPVTTEVVIGPREFSKNVAIPLFPAGPSPGSLTIDWVDDTFDPIGDFLLELQYPPGTFDIRAPGHRLFARTGEPILNLMPGPWELLLIPAESDPLAHVASVEAQVTVLPGEGTELRLVSPRMARIEITVSTADGLPLEFAGSEVSWRSDQGGTEEVSSWYGATAPVDRNPTGQPIGGIHRGSARRSTRKLTNGQPGISRELLTPGPGTLTVQVPGYLEVSRELTLPPGSTTKVSLALVRD